jgi:hypothetical protein
VGVWVFVTVGELVGVGVEVVVVGIMGVTVMGIVGVIVGIMGVTVMGIVGVTVGIVGIVGVAVGVIVAIKSMAL